jgi:hypothetical protein
MTGSPWGGLGAYQAEFGVEFLYKQSTLLVRPNLGYTRLLSKTPEDGQVLYDLLGIYGGLDLVYNVSKRLPLTAVAGPSFHSWRVERRITGPQGSQGNPAQGETSLRLGFRMGLGYKFSEAYRVEFVYTMTEWRSNNKTVANGGPGFVEGFNPSFPSYYTLKATYTF